MVNLSERIEHIGFRFVCFRRCCLHPDLTQPKTKDDVKKGQAIINQHDIHTFKTSVGLAIQDAIAPDDVPASILVKRLSPVVVKEYMVHCVQKQAHMVPTIHQSVTQQGLIQDSLWGELPIWPLTCIIIHYQGSQGTPLSLYETVPDTWNLLYGYISLSNYSMHAFSTHTHSMCTCYIIESYLHYFKFITGTWI